jgi:hypothetical protein
MHGFFAALWVTLAGAPAPTLTGQWDFAERDMEISIVQDAAGAWQGTATKSPRKDEVGDWVLRDVVYDEEKRAWRGTLVTDDQGSARAVISFSNSDTLQVVASKLIFSKTLIWTRHAR